jgi:membrane-bound serine protease (ClpP class)
MSADCGLQLADAQAGHGASVPNPESQIRYPNSRIPNPKAEIRIPKSALSGGLFLLAIVLGARAQEPPRMQGEWIMLPGEITSEAFTQFKIDTERAIKSGARVLVYHFQAGEISNFGPCVDLANYLLDRIEARVETVAFIDGALNGNAVLAALACNKVYMAAGGNGRTEASIGFTQPAIDKTAPIDRTKLQAYLNMADRRGRPAALVLKMLDPALVVYQFEAGGKRYKLDAAGVERLGLPDSLALGPEEQRLQPQVYAPAGKPGVYSAREAEAAGLSSRTVASAQQLVERLGLPPAVLRGNLQGVPNPRAAVIEVHDEIDGGTVDMVLRKVAKAIDVEKVNCIILQLGTARGGLKSAERAEKLARELRERCKAAGVLTVAFIPEQCTGAANFLAFACDQIVLGPRATLGDCRALVYESPTSKILNDEATVRDVKQQLVNLAEQQLYSPVLIRGMFEIDLEIIAARQRPDPNKPQDGGTAIVYLPRSEVRGDWEPAPLAPLKKPGQLLILPADVAVQVGLARAALLTTEIDGVLNLYGIKKGDARIMPADWLDALVELLRNQVTMVFLVVVGFTCIILELKSPGLTIPGVIAAVCFVLVFWSQSWLAGELNALAILMFLLGIVLLGVEVFILPGFGVTGVAGVVLMLLGLSLLIVKQWPQSMAEYEELGKRFALFAGVLVIAVVAAFGLAKYLPQIPVVNRLMLPPPDEETSDAAATMPPAVAPELLGKIGTAVTELRPAGKACFDDEYIDVVLEGGYVDAGAKVQVIEIDGLRVMVKAV